MPALHTHRLFVPHYPASALRTLAGTDPESTVLLHAVSDGVLGAETVLSTDGPVTGHHEFIAREDGFSQPVSEHLAINPQPTITFKAFRWLGKGTQVDVIANYQSKFELQAHAVTYTRVRDHELNANEIVEMVFAAKDRAAVRAMIEHSNVSGWKAHGIDTTAAHEVGHEHGHRERHIGESHVLHVAPGPGLAAELHWAAHRSGVRVHRLRAVEADTGVAMILALDGAKSRRKDFVERMRSHLNSPIRHRRLRPPFSVSHGKIWVQASAATGGNLRMTDMVARKGLPFSFLQTASDHGTDMLQGILDAGDRHVRTVCHGLHTWGKQQKVDVHTHILTDDGLGLEE